MKDFKPYVLSDVLITEYVLKNEDNERFKLDSSWDSSENFADYVILYKIALVLIALLNIEKKNNKFLHVRLAFEKAIFTDDNVQKLYFYNQVKSAMDKLVELLDAKNYNIDKIADLNDKMPWTMTWLRSVKVIENGQAIIHSSSVLGMGWAMAWLSEAGIIDTNPVRLAEFSWSWMDSYLAISNFLNECNPIV